FDTCGYFLQGLSSFASCQGSAGLQQAFQAGKNLGPTAAYAGDGLRALSFGLVGDFQFDEAVLGYDLEGAAGVALGRALRNELVPPLEHEAARRVYLEVSAAVVDRPPGVAHFPRGAGLPVALEMRAK